MPQYGSIWKSALMLLKYAVDIAVGIGCHESCLNCHGQGYAAIFRVEVSSKQQGHPPGGQACMHSLPHPQILHKISSYCSVDKMIIFHCREVVHASEALLPPENAIWQPPVSA